MSGQRFLLPATGSNEVSKSIPKRDEKLPHPNGGKPKRTQIQNACTSCRERKSKCDGVRYLPLPHPHHRCHKSPDDPAGSPVCSLCQTSGRECEYNTGEGETRWAALHRKNRTLERERDEARELLALMQLQTITSVADVAHVLMEQTEVNDFIAEGIDPVWLWPTVTLALYLLRYADCAVFEADCARTRSSSRDRGSSFLDVWERFVYPVLKAPEHNEWAEKWRGGHITNYV